MGKHTAGPWKVKEIKTSCGRVFKIDREGEDRAHDCIACIYDDNTTLNERNHNEHEANAAFIVTACNSHDELLEACKQLLDKYEIALMKLTGNTGFNVSTLREYARQAIAHAEASQ
jgi:ActR/RegA family two-component response regulator